MSVVQSSIVRIREALCISSALTESCFGSLFSHFSLQVAGVVAGEKGGEGGGEKNMTIGSHTLVLDFSMSSIQNLFTRGNWSILFASYIMQNSLLLEGSLLPKPYLSRPRDLLSAPSIALPLTALCPSGRDSLLPGSLHLCTCSSLLEAWGRVSKQH